MEFHYLIRADLVCLYGTKNDALLHK